MIRVVKLNMLMKNELLIFQHRNVEHAQPNGIPLSEKLLPEFLKVNPGLKHIRIFE